VGEWQSANIDMVGMMKDRRKVACKSRTNWRLMILLPHLEVKEQISENVLAGQGQGYEGVPRSMK
jgi:hypothetical protein